MERNYIAFISYRHLPLDIATAKKLHKRIERYVIPRELRQDGRKKLGLVFRDQDELPISSNLSDNIREALDRSAYLIVICTPESAKSPWVQREIRYFLEHHDRDHVLAVLADGTPESAFPALLTQVRSPEGDLLDQIEPLAANIVADNERKRRRLFRVESLRILAALIGCPFDDLYRRELRFRRRRAAAAIGTCALVTAAFIGMLLNRNAEIRAQLTRALISESQTLAALSEQAYREGDYNGALGYALQALPGEGRERPYVAEAEYALSRELDLYRQGVLRYARSLEQDAMISALALSSDGKYLVTADGYGTLRFWDLESGVLIRQQNGAAILSLSYLDTRSAVFCLGGDGASLYDIATGEILWQRRDIGMLDIPALSADGQVGLVTNAMSATPGAAERISLLDLTDGRDLGDIQISDGPSRFCAAAAFSEDAALAALLLQRTDSSFADLILWHIDNGEVQAIDSDIPYSAGAVACRLLFTKEGDLLLGCDNRDGQSFLRLYAVADDWAMRYETPLETEKVTLEIGGGASFFASVDLFGCAGKQVVFGCKHELYMLNLPDGKILWRRTLPGFLLAGQLYDNACMGLVLDDGTVTFCSDDGYLSYSMGIYSFKSGYTLTRAAISGDNYPESHVILVSEDHPQRASLVRFVDNQQMFPVGVLSSAVRHTSLISSPSGNLILALGYDPTGKPVEALLLDAAAGSSGENFPLPTDGGWEDPGQLSLTEDGLLLSPSCELNARTHEITPLSVEREEGLLPANMEETVYALGEKSPLLAIWDGERLRIRDLESGSEMDAGALPPTTSKMLFACDDELLFSFSETGTLCVFRVSDGSLLHSSQYGDLGLHFRGSGARYTVAQTTGEERLLLFYDDPVRDQTVCLVIDREIWACVGAYDNVAAYLPSRDSVLVCQPMDAIYFSPYHSSEEILESAAQLVEMSDRKNTAGS